MPRPHLTPGKDPVSIVQEAGWASGPVWTGAENLAPTGIQSPDRPAHRQSLYGLRYPAHYNTNNNIHTLHLSSHCHSVFCLMIIRFTAPFLAVIPFCDNEHILCTQDHL